MTRPARSSLTAWLVPALCTLASTAAAQDFPATEPPGPASSSMALIERALPGPEAPGAIEAGLTSWLGVPDLVTRAVCAGAGVGPARAAIGFSRTGVPETGWDAVGAAFGAAFRHGGAALRAVGRQDRSLAALGRTDESRGLEAGGGAWVRAGGHASVWARAPQVWTGGLSPPLARPLVVGLSVDLGQASAWLERESPSQPRDETGIHAFGLTVGFPAARVWAEWRERPLRGAVGVAVRARRVAVGARAEGHPVLGDTVSLWLSLVPPRRPLPP